MLLKSIHTVSEGVVGGLHQSFPDATCDSREAPCALRHGNFAYAEAEKSGFLKTIYRIQ